MTVDETTTGERPTIVGTFDHAAYAERALTGLREAGIRPAWTGIETVVPVSLPPQCLQEK